MAKTEQSTTNAVDWSDQLLPKKKQAKIIHDNWLRAKEVVEEREEGWEEMYNGYRSYFELPEDAGVSEIAVPSIFADIESYMPRIAGNRAEIGVWPRAEDDRLRANLHRFLVGQFWDAERMNIQMVDYAKSAKIYGTAIWKVVYEKREQKRLMRVAEEQPVTFLNGLLTLDGQTEERQSFEEAMEVIQNGPRVYLMDLDEIYPDPDGWSMESCKWVIHKKRTDIEDVIASIEAGEEVYNETAVRKALQWMQKSNQEDKQTDTLEYNRDAEFGDLVQGTDPHKRVFHELECWYDGKIVSIILENPELDPIQYRMNPLGRKPFVKFCPIPLPKEFYGLSLVEILMPLAVELNLLHAARLDNLLYASHQMFKILRTANIAPQELTFRPGGAVEVDDMGDIQELNVTPKNFAVYREVDEIRSWQQRAGGATDTFQGISSDLTGGTATEANLLAEASGSRVGLMLKLLTEGPLHDLGQLVVIQNELFMDESTQIRTTGQSFAADPEFTTIRPEDLVNRTGLSLDLKIDVASTDPESRQLRLQRGTAAIQTFGNAGMPLQHPLMERFLQEVAEGFGVDDAPALIEQGRQVLAQIQAQEQAAAQQGGSAPAASEAELLAAQGGAAAGGQVI